MAQPRGTLNGHFRVTEQGEMINQHFGHPGIAVNTLDIYTAAVLHYMYVVAVPAGWSGRGDVVRGGRLDHKAVHLVFDAFLSWDSLGDRVG